MTEAKGSARMQTMVWAIGSMVVLMLIIFFVPSGYTLKGKILVVFTSFILSLCGFAATTIFPLWQTDIMLIALIFFFAYFLSKHLGNFIVKADSVDQETSHRSEAFKDAALQEMKEELILPVFATANFETDRRNDIIPSLSNIEEITKNYQEPINGVNNQSVYGLLENNYLSDIESLIESESETKLEDSFKEIDDDLLPIISNAKVIEQNEKDEDLLDDSLFDFLRVQTEDETKEKVSFFSSKELTVR